MTNILHTSPSILGNFILPSTVISIESMAFLNSSGLKNINTSFSNIDGVIYNKNQTKLIRCPITHIGRYSIPW